MKIRIALTVMFLFLLGIATSWADAPRLINFQGKLTDSLGNPVSDGAYSIRFRIYDDSSAGNVLWEETDPVQISKGLFTVLLGSTSAVPESAFYSVNRWLGIKVGSNPEIAPRQRLGSVGYAFQSGQWNSLDSNLFRLNGNVSIGTGPSPGYKLNVFYPGSSPSALTASRGEAINSSTGNATGIVGVGTSSSGNAYGGYFTGSSTSGGSYGVYGSGGTYGLYGTSPSGIGVYGSGSQYGVYTTSGNIGVWGSGGYIGVFGVNATYGVYGQSIVNGGAAVFGNIGGNFGTYGGYFQGDVKVERNLIVNGTSYSSAGVNASSSSGAGVVASGFTNGVEATGGTRGVYATGSNYGVVGGGLYGVYGVATQGFQGYGVYGSAGGISGTWAGAFDRDVYIAGFLAVDGYIYKNGGGFRIDHPTDPANKYLYHSFVESPDMMNIYNGNVVTDANGDATVSLPDWFGALNKDFRYQLTVIGQFAQAIISQEIANNRFSIKTDKPSVKVSWQVTGIRQDAYANTHRILVEVAKTGKEKGRYLHPEEYGAPPSLGMHYEEEQRMAAERKQMEEQKVKMEQESLSPKK